MCILQPLPLHPEAEAAAAAKGGGIIWRPQVSAAAQRARFFKPSEAAITLRTFASLRLQATFTYMFSQLAPVAGADVSIHVVSAASYLQYIYIYIYAC